MWYGEFVTVNDASWIDPDHEDRTLFSEGRSFSFFFSGESDSMRV